MDNYDRYGLQVFKIEYLYQHLDYLKGLYKELELGDFYEAKKYYM